MEWPLYNQPSDASAYQENKRKNVAFKRRLLEYFKKRNTEKESRNSYLTDTYSKMMQDWLRKVDKIESSTKRKGKEAKNREFFEKVFPELRKQREDKERYYNTLKCFKFKIYFLFRTYTILRTIKPLLVHFCSHLTRIFLKIT